MHAEFQHKKHAKEENKTQLSERKVIRIDVPEGAKTCQCQDPDDGSAGEEQLDGGETFDHRLRPTAAAAWGRFRLSVLFLVDAGVRRLCCEFLFCPLVA